MITRIHIYNGVNEWVVRDYDPSKHKCTFKTYLNLMMGAIRKRSPRPQYVQFRLGMLYRG